jgi:hypothetical protein
MKNLGLVLLANLLIPTFAIAQGCGVLDFGTDDGAVWDYRKGQFSDLDAKSVFDTVPKKKIITVTQEAGNASIEKVLAKRSKNSKPSVKFNVSPVVGKSIATLKKGSNLIALLEGSGADTNFLLINSTTGSVWRASIAASIVSGKIVFVKDENATFFPDSCSDNRKELPIE